MGLMMDVSHVKSLIGNVITREDLKEVIEILRPIAINNQSMQITDLIKDALEKSKCIEDFELAIFLYDLQIRQIYHLNDHLDQICDIISEMKHLAKRVNSANCNALVKQLTWYVEKLKGNKERSSLSINEAMKLVESGCIDDSYTYFSVKYSYAIEEWLEHDNHNVTNLLEDCVSYFLEKAMYRSFAQSLGILSVIYQRTNNYREAEKTSEKILGNRSLMEKLSPDIKSIVYYFTGVGQLLQSNLSNAEIYFNEALMILEQTQASLYYNYYYVRTISHIATIKALLGNWESAFSNMKKIETLIQDTKITKNFDNHSINQVPHTFNLIKFYIYSRLKSFEHSDNQDLIESIFNKLERQYSHPILLIEFILNSSLEKDRLEILIKSDFDNLKRVKHIINYELLKKKKIWNKQDNLAKNCIEILEEGMNTKKRTYLEAAFTDLLIAKELFSLGDYEGIYLLLRKYSNRTDRLEVLEFRIFMEAFIQVGAYKTGNPLGPALQYMAIKKCKQYGFSRLEDKLLEYLTIQGNDALRLIV